MSTERLLRLPNFLKRYGLYHGLRLGFGVRGSGGDVSLPASPFAVPDYQRPLWLRPTRSDYSIFWQCVVREQYDIAQYPHHERLLARARSLQAAGRVPVVVDGGGNIGMSLRIFARDYPFAHVVSVEPDADNLRVLSANARELSSPNTVVHGAVASQSGHCRVIRRDRGSAMLMTERCAATDPEAVRTHSVPELVAMVPGGAPWIIKLDIEGGQDELFSQNTDWIAEADLIILELDDIVFPWSGSSISFFRAIAPHRFDYLLGGEHILCFRHQDAEGG